jgi:hypothetical protein
MSWEGVLGAQLTLPVPRGLLFEKDQSECRVRLFAAQYQHKYKPANDATDDITMKRLFLAV